MNFHPFLESTTFYISVLSIYDSFLSITLRKYHLKGREKNQTKAMKIFIKILNFSKMLPFIYTLFFCSVYFPII